MRIVFSALLFAVVITESRAAGQWYLMARHGECAPIRSLERKVPGIRDVADPQGFIDLMRSRGAQVRSKPLGPQAPAPVEVLVPEHGLALVFVPASLCAKVESR